MIRRFVLPVCFLGMACGSKTGLRDYRYVVDASTDDVEIIEPVCRPLRVRTRVNTDVTLTSEVDRAVSRELPYSWSLRNGPTRSRAMLRDGSMRTARFTPDATGTYEFLVTTPYILSTGEALVCPATIVAEPEDPLCPEYALTEPVVVPLPGSSMQFAWDPVWSTPRINAGGPEGTGIVVSDVSRDDVAALVMETVATRPLDETAGEIEGRIASVIGATPVLVGRGGSTSDGLRYRRSSFRVVAQPTTAAVVRDRVARDVAGLNPGVYQEGFSTATTFVLEVTTVLRPEERRAVVLFATAPETLYDTAMRSTAYRLRDVTNASGLSRTGARYDVTCQRDMATRTVAADFLWLVDTSRSMEDDQERLGNTAERFFAEMNSAGIDLRVGVLQAGNIRSGIDLDSPGFEWISGSDPRGPQQLAWQVTYRAYRDDPADTQSPYPFEGQEEEPLAAGVVATEAMEARAASDPTSRRSFRPDATRVAFFVTDEIGTNDDNRFFARFPMTWGATGAERVLATTQWFARRSFLTFAMSNLFTRAPCPNVDNFVACVVQGNNGAYIPLNTALDAEVAAALSRIADSVAGAASEFQLDRAPISSTLRVAVETRLAPRSRADGFDWDQDSRSLVFRGNTYRPRRGQMVRSAYFWWVR
jgi:hypothetical protein